MNEDLANNIAALVGLSGLIPALGVTLTYGIFAPWHKSWFGRVMFTLFAAFTLVYVAFALQHFIGRFPGYGLFSLTVFAIIMIALWGVWIVIIREQILIRPIKRTLLFRRNRHKRQ